MDTARIPPRILAMWALAASGAARKGVVAAPAVGDSSPAKGDWEVRPARGDAPQGQRRETFPALGARCPHRAPLAAHRARALT